MLEQLAEGMNPHDLERLKHDILCDDIVATFIHGVIVGIERCAYFKDGTYYTGKGDLTLAQAVSAAIEEANSDIEKCLKS